MSRPDPPFRPLNSPDVSKKTSAPATPVNWFERIAPRIPTPPPPDVANLRQDSSGQVVTRAAFRSVEEIADQQRLLWQVGTPEPPEITMLRSQAHDEAGRLIGQALEQAQTIEQEARERGYKAGHEKGYSDGHHEALRVEHSRSEDERTLLKEDLQMFITLVEKERERIWEEFEPQIVGLVFDLTKQVIKQEVEMNRNVALSMVRNALRRCSETGTLRIRVHPEDLEAVRGNRDELLNLVDGIRHLEIIEDRRVDLGGCVVETEAGTIDARVETQLAEVADTLEQIVSHREDSL